MFGRTSVNECIDYGGSGNNGWIIGSVSTCFCGRLGQSAVDGRVDGLLSVGGCVRRMDGRTWR